MDKKIEIAKYTLADIFNIRKVEFDRPISRKGDVVEARRFLIYFLVNELGMRFSHIPQKMQSIKSHATAMHHFYKMVIFLESEPKIKIKYLEFINTMTEQGMDKLDNELVKQIKIKNSISRNINKLKSMINEA